MVICQNPDPPTSWAQNLSEKQCWRVRNSILGGNVYCSTGGIATATVACHSGMSHGACPCIAKSSERHSHCSVVDKVPMRDLDQIEGAIACSVFLAYSPGVGNPGGCEGRCSLRGSGGISEALPPDWPLISAIYK